jgi:hypothetical protein
MQRFASLTAIGLLLASAVAAFAFGFWLSREYALYALVLFVFLVMGGITSSSHKNLPVHSVLLGAVIGLLVGISLGTLLA